MNYTNSPHVFELNEHVSYYNFSKKEWLENYGKVVGSATVVTNGMVRNLVMVELTEKYYDPSGEHFLSIVAINADSLRPSN